MLTAFWPDWAAQLSDIDPHGLAASLGQVHRCRGPDGDDLALKIRYPGMAEQVDDELKLLDLLPALGPLKKWSIDLDGYRSLLRRSVASECNYCQEAESQSRYRRRLDPDEGISVAAIHAHGTTAGTLLQDWLPARPWHDSDRCDLDSRRQLATILLRHWLTQVWHRGEVHADPHPGNYGVVIGPRPGVALYDFGCLANIPAAVPIALSRMILALRQHETVDLLPALAALGFDADKLIHIHRQVPALCRIMVWPFLHDGAQDLKDWRPRQRIDDLLGEHRWWFRSAGAPDLFLRMRSFAGLVRQLRQLGPPLDWFGILQSIEPDLAGRADLPLPLVDCPPTPADSLAEHLHILITETNATVVDLSLPATVIDQLDEVMDSALVQRLAARGLDLAGLVRASQQDGYRPGPIFTDTDGPRTVLVELQ